MKTMAVSGGWWRALRLLGIACAAALIGLIGRVSSAQPAGDADGDGVLNGIDLCAGTPGGALVSSLGCSAEQVCPCNYNGSRSLSCILTFADDLLSRGVLNDQAWWAFVSSVLESECEFLPGGPPPDSTLDSDGDGVPDRVDLCPRTPEGLLVNMEGCAVEQACPCDINGVRSLECISDFGVEMVRAGLLLLPQLSAYLDNARAAECPSGGGPTDTSRLTLKPVGDRVITIGESLSIMLEAVPPTTAPPGPRESVSYMIDPLPLPGGATLEAHTGVFAWRPMPEQVGQYTMVFSATDGVDRPSESVRLTVQAPPAGTVTSLRGRVIDTNAFVNGSGEFLPVVNARVSILGSPVSVLTGPDGVFLLEGIPGGNQVFDINTSMAMPAPDGSGYAGFREKLEIFPNTVNVIDRPFYLPRIDAATLTTVNPSAITTVTSAALGVSLSVPVNSARNPDGTLFRGQLSISLVPEALAPASLPDFLKPGMLITIQPVGVTFNTPAPISFPNFDGLTPNSEADLWSLNPQEGVFTVVGTMRVSADGTRVNTISGGIRATDWHMPMPPQPADNPGDDNNENDEDGMPNPEGCGGGEAETGSSSSLRSGRLSERHQLVSYRSMGETRSLSLIYNSIAADPRPIVNANSTIVQRAAVPNTVSMRVRVGGVDQGAEVHTSTAGLNESINETIRTGIQFDANLYPTGLYPYQMRLTSHYPQSSLSTLRSNAALINNERNSPFGAGWSIAGLQRLHLRDGVPQAVLTEGDGGIKVFLPQQSQTQQFTDLALVLDGSGSISSGDWSLQRDGFAQAIEDPSVVPHDGAVAVSVIQFAGGTAVTHIPLTVLSSTPQAAALAAQIRAIGQRGGGTPIHAGVNAAVAQLIPGRSLARKVICLSTDGQPDSASLALQAANNAVAAGVDEIDALAVGPGASVSFLETFVRNGFVVTVANFQQFRDAIRDKLRALVAGSPAGEFSTLARNPDGTFTRRMKDGTVHTFNAAGLHVSALSRTGALTTFEYDSNNCPVRMTDPAGLMTNFSYMNGRLKQVTDPSGRVTTFDHDANGCLTKIVDPDGSQREFAYDNKFRLIGQTSKLGLSTAYAYNFAGRHTSATHPDGTIRRLEPGRIVGLVNTDLGQGTPTNPAPFVRPSQNIARFIDADGGTEQYSLDGFGFPTQSTDALGRTVSTVRNSDGLPTQVTYPNGRIDQYTYDEIGNLIRFLEAVGTAQQRETRYEYEQVFNLLTRITDPAGKITRFEYDSNGNLTRTTNALGAVRTRTYVPGTDLVSTDTDENGNTTTFAYDAKGLLETVTDAEGNVTTYIRDQKGNVLSVTEGSGSSAARTRSFTYDNQNRVRTATDGEGGVTTFTYDAKGNLTETRNPTGQIVRRIYDQLDRVIRVEDPIRGTTEMTYDGRGNLLTQTDALGAVTSFTYDAASQLLRSTDALGGVERYAYDPMGNVTTFTDALNHATTFQYDRFNRRTRRTNPLNQFATFAYDSRDNLVTQVTPNGHTITNTYDDLSRLTRTATPDNTIDYTYDAVGNLLTCFDNDSRLSWTYDRVNRVRTANTLPGGIQPVTTLMYMYDAVGNRTRMEDSEGGVTLYSYDDAGRLRFLTTPAGDLIEQTYDPAGRLDDLIYPNGITADYQYEPRTGRLSRLRHASVSSTLLDFQYGYNAVGNITSIAEPTHTRVYTYDELQRLRTADSIVAPGVPAVGSFEGVDLDAAGAMTASGADADTGDSAGSKTGRTTRGPVIPPPEFYNYDAVGNRTSSHLSANHIHDAANRLLQDDQFNYTYDANGNLRTKTDRVSGEVTTYGWSAQDQLLSLGLPHGAILQNQYDGRSRKIASGLSISRIVYVLDFSHTLLRISGSERLAYVYGTSLDHLLCTFSSPDSIEYYHVDHLTSVVHTSSGMGLSTSSHSYSSYGEPLDPSAVTTSRVQHAGREFEQDSELLYLRARWYDPRAGRFISEDPLGFESDDRNFYNYGLNSPITRLDPFGTDSLLFDGKQVTHKDDAGKVLGTYPASSGRDGSQNFRMRDFGPIPPGKYTLNPSEISEGGFFRNLLGDWGQYRAPLHPQNGTETFDRDGFFLHGGEEPGSAGCIDLGRNDKTVFPKLKAQQDPVTVCVEYMSKP